MLIKPKTNQPSVLNMSELMLTNTKRMISITFTDDTETPANIVEEFDVSGNPKGTVELQVQSIGGNEYYTETYFPNTNPATRRIQNLAVGKYGVKWGDTSDETTDAGAYAFVWHVRKDETDEDNYGVQLVNIVSPKVLSLLPKFRLLIDKSLKVIVPEEYCNLGYTDAMLITFLEAGLQRINAAQPYVSWGSLEQFPISQYSEILLSSALLFGLQSQALFAIDTDIPQFSSDGHSFALSHFQQINMRLQSLEQDLARRIREFKMHFVGAGVLGAEFRIGWGWYQMIASSPPGSLFRNTFTNL